MEAVRPHPQPRHIDREDLRIFETLNNIVKIVAILRFDGEGGRAVVSNRLNIGTTFGIVGGVAFLLSDETTEIKLSVC